MMQEHRAATSGVVSIGAGVIGWVANAMPLFQAASLLVSILVGLATLVWYGLKFRDRAKAQRGE